MSSVLRENFAEFEDELQRQSGNLPIMEECVKKTRVDDDGTVMEWDESRKAWFPKLDEEFMASYQLNFGLNPLTADIPPEQNSVHSAWAAYAAQIEQLKSERGENNPEIQEELQAASAALAEYYSSPSYRIWYEEFVRNQIEKNNSKIFEASTEQSPRHVPKKQPVILSADEALERAETEQLLGVPLNISESSDNKEAGNMHETSNNSEELSASRKRRKKGPPEWYNIEAEKNTHVYISGLPPTINEAEFIELMSKCGIIMNDPLTEKLRVKLYKDADGNYKGDGLCCYIKIESVHLAMQILDGMLYEPGYMLHVETAKFQPKENFDHTKHRRLTAKEKKKFKKQQEGLFKWRVEASKLIRGKKERVIILRSVFDEADLGLDVSLIPVIRERIRQQCVKVGIIKKIVVYDANPEGVVSVTFSSPEEADMAVNFLDKALFTYPAPNLGEDQPTSGPRTRQLSVERWDGKERFDKQESQDEELDRIARWNRFLDGGTHSQDDEDANVANDTDQCDAEKNPTQVSEAVDTDEELLTRNADSDADTD